MNTPVPVPDSIPTAWGWFQFFLLLTFPLHLLFMNSLLGASVVAVRAHLKGEELAHELAKVIPLLIALTVNFGVAPLLFLQVLHGHLFYTSSILMGAFWIALVPLLLLAYYGAYWYDFGFKSLGRFGVVLLLTVIAVILFIGFVFSNNLTLMMTPQSWPEFFSVAGGSRLNLGEPTLWPRYLHFIVGGLAVGGLFVWLYGGFLGRHNTEVATRAATAGRKMFLWLTLAQIPLGVWFLLALPKEQMMLYMGGHGPATAVFVSALVMIAVLLVAAFRKRLGVTVAMTVGLVYLMAFIRDFLRDGYLRDIFHPRMLTVDADVSPLVFFLINLAIGLALVAWMLRAAWRCQSRND